MRNAAVFSSSEAVVVLVAMVTLSAAITPTAPEGPLHLSPYLDAGEVETAQELSRVKDTKCDRDVRSDCDTAIPESHAGYLTVDREMGKHMFFWYFPSQTTHDAPLSIWLNGGPSLTSMLGLLWEHGPLQPRRNHSKTRPVSVIPDNFVPGEFEARKVSWDGLLSMVYIDNPVGAGYSYAEREDPNARLSQEGYTEDLYRFVEQFYLLFPDLMDKELYIGGQSYAGKYVPALAYRIHRARRRGEARLPLAGIYIGGAFFAPEIMTPSSSEYLYSMGAITKFQVTQHRTSTRPIVYNHTVAKDDSDMKDIKMHELFEKLWTLQYIPSSHNYVAADLANYRAIRDIMISERLRHAVHVGKRPFKSYNLTLYEKFVSDLLSSTRAKMGALLDSGLYKVLVYNGDYDVIVNSRMVEEALLQTSWAGQAEYVNASRTMWHGPPVDETGDSRRQLLYGFYSRTRNLCRVVVHGAGHQVPHDAPEVSVFMMAMFIRYGCLQVP